MRNRVHAGHGVARTLLLVVVVLCTCSASGVSLALGATLPDSRSYELVTPLEKNGVEVGAGVPSTSGDSVNWEAPGGCCGVSSAGQTLYQSTRGEGGWQTKSLTPKPNRPLLGVTEEQNPVFWSSDLSQTIFTTPASYAAGDERPQGDGDQDLYLQGPSGSLTWLSQGPFPGNGSAPDSATFDGAAPDASHVVFNSAAQLTPEATGLSSALNTPPTNLYERDVAAESTQLVNIFSTTLAADATGHVATSLTAPAVGTTTTGLTVGAGPAVATTLTAAASGRVATALTTAAAEGATSIAVTSTVGFSAHQQITIDTGEEQETATIEAVTDATHLALAGGLAHGHAAGAAVVYGGDIMIAVASTEGLAPGEQVTIGTGGTEETVSVAAVLDATELVLAAGLTHDHTSGTAVKHAADSSLTVGSTEGFAAGQSIAVEAETATIAAVTDATHLALSAPLTSPHPEGATVSHAGETSIVVASTAGLRVGESLTIEAEGAAQETVGIAAIPDATHLTLSAPLANSHAPGTQVLYEGDRSITVASTANLKAGQPISIDDGASTETATVAAVTDATHLELAAGLTHAHAAGASVTQLVSPDGAILGSGVTLGSFLGADAAGTTTNAISGDGSKVFFESPPPPPGEETPAGNQISQHLYMRDMATGTTTPLDDPSSSETTRYEGASQDGSLAFFTSRQPLAGEGGPVEPAGELDGEGNDHLNEGPNELYEFNTTAQPIGPAAPMSVAAVSGGNRNSPTTLAANAQGPITVELTVEAPKGATTLDVTNTEGFVPGQLIVIETLAEQAEGYEPETATIAAVPDATHLVLTSGLVNGTHGHPLPYFGPVRVHYAGDAVLTVASTAGLMAGSRVQVGSGTSADAVEVASVTDATHLALVEPVLHSHTAGTEVSQLPTAGDVIGVTAISNDGSHVYFVADGTTPLALNKNAQGQAAKSGEPNLYVFDSGTGVTTFIATVAWPDVNGCAPICSTGHPSGLVAEPDVERPAVPTPDGSVLVFDSSADLTGQDPDPATTLSADVLHGERTIAVASTKGFAAGHTISIGTGGGEELDFIEAVDDATHLTLTELGPSATVGLAADHAAGAKVTQLHDELYRYEASDGALVCISCTPAGVTPTGSATLGDAGGGSYGPPMTALPMNESGTQIFFQSPDPLVPEAVNTGSFASGPFGSLTEPTDVYEWENGKVSLISSGSSTAGATFDGTTPSGSDVFLTTAASLLGSDPDGFNDIYDARVDGGFPEPAAPPAPCNGAGCRPGGGASVFFSVPGSASVTGQGNLAPQRVTGPSFTVGVISATQRAKSAKSSKLTLSVSATAAGKISAHVFAKLHGQLQRVGSASVTLGNAGKRTLTLHLSGAARKALAKHGKLALRVEVSYSASGTVKVATLTLSKGRAKKASAATKGSVASLPTHRGRVRGA